MQSKRRYILLKSIGNLFTVMIVLINAISIFVHKESSTIPTMTIAFTLILSMFFNIYLSNIDISKIGEDSLIVSNYKEAIRELKEKNDYIILRNNKLESIRLNYKKDVDKARNMIEYIIPQKLPHGKNISGSFLYMPIEAVGGDYYDFIYTSKNKILFLIADITGHGIGSAIVLPMIKTAFYILAKPEMSTNNILEDMNNFLIRILPKNYFLTACLAEIDLQYKKLRYTNASHTPMIIRRGSKIVELESNNTLIGLFPKAVFIEKSFDLENGDSLLFYTDGITEASLSQNKYDFYGIENLKNAMLRANDKSSSSILKEIKEDFFDYLSYKSPDDDCSIVVFKITQ